jgi:porin
VSTGESTVEESTPGLLPNPLQKYGIKFAATYIDETLGNVSGTLKQGAVYDGRLNLADRLAKAGRTARVYASCQHVSDPRRRAFPQQSAEFFGGERIEALPSTRLHEIWFEQKWETTLSLGAGQLAADTEFINAKYADVFTNASIGWPAITSVNLPSGGPSPPLAVLGARLRANLTDNCTVSAAIFDGNAAGRGWMIRNCATITALIFASTIRCW